MNVHEFLVLLFNVFSSQERERRRQHMMLTKHLDMKKKNDERKKNIEKMEKKMIKKKDECGGEG